MGFCGWVLGILGTSPYFCHVSVVIHAFRFWYFNVKVLVIVNVLVLIVAVVAVVVVMLVAVSIVPAVIANASFVIPKP